MVASCLKISILPFIKYTFHMLDSFETALPFNPLLSDRRLVLNTAESIHVVRPHELIRCEAASNYTCFYLKGNRKIVVSKPLGEYEPILEQWAFLRVHQSHLINMQYLQRYDKKNGVIIMHDQSNVPVSSRKKERLLELLRN